MMPDPLQAAKASAVVVGHVLDAARDNPQFKAAGDELGKAALTLGKTINNALLPLAAVNFAFEKAREYFANRFASDLAAKAGGIPDDLVVEPKASIAGPALQGLAFSHDEPELKDLYLALLTSSMDARSAASAHPGFVEVIRQMTSDEARLLRSILGRSATPIVELRVTTVGEKGWHTIQSHVADIRQESDNAPVEDARLPAMVDNWIRLGLVHVTYSKYLQGKGADPYAWTETRPEVVRAREQFHSDARKVTAERGILARTAFGLDFARAVGIVAPIAPKEPPPSPPTPAAA